MTTRITQVDGQAEKITTLRVEGSLRLAEAELLDSTYLELRAKHQGRIGLDVLYPNFIALFVFTAILVGVSAWRFRKQLN